MARINLLSEIVKGIKPNIYAVDNLSPVSRVALYIKAGSRYEPDEVPGITHYLSEAARITNENSSSFAISRYLERNGATLNVTNDREHLIYRIDCLRNKLGNVLHFIDDAIHRPEFRSWELFDFMRPRLTELLKQAKKNQTFVVNEALHKAAYRGGLAHSTLIPEHQISKIQRSHLLEFVDRNYVLNRMSFIGMGVDEKDLTNILEKNFKFNENDYKGVDGATKYLGGEARIQAGFPQTMVNFVVEGCSIKDLKGQAALEVISSLLGDKDQTYIKYGSGSDSSLSKVLDSVVTGLKVSVVNINHSDTGLFGIALQGPNEHMKKGTRKAVSYVKSILSGINESQFKAAKASLKSRSLIASENGEFVFNAVAYRFANGVVGQSPLDHLEKLTLKEVQGVASKLLKTKSTIVSVGNPRFVPYLHELES